MYDFLEMLGYQISDEERLLMSGEHPGFQPGKDEDALEKKHTCRGCGATTNEEDVLDWIEPDLCPDCAYDMDEEDDADD